MKSKIVENTVAANAPNIATTDENLSVDAMFQQSELPSLGKQIFSVLPMTGPTAALFNLRNYTGADPLKANDFELVRAEVTCVPSVSISTGITQEAVQDLNSQFGKNSKHIIGRLLRGLANDAENTDTIAFLETNSVLGVNLVRTDAANAETSFFELTQRVHELILQMNSLHLRTYEAFVVLPYNIAASIMGLKQYVEADSDDERGLFITKIGNTKFYMNPVATSNTAYVGLTDSENPSKSSAVFSPFEATVVSSVNPDSGDLGYHIYNRYAITASPLHVPGEEMLHKFTVV